MSDTATKPAKGDSTEIAEPMGTAVGGLSLLDDAERVTIPPSGKEYLCPACEEPIPNKRVIYLAKPPRYQHVLNDIIRCPREKCRFVFSPRSEAIVLRQ